MGGNPFCMDELLSFHPPVSSSFLALGLPYSGIWDRECHRMQMKLRFFQLFHSLPCPPSFHLLGNQDRNSCTILNPSPSTIPAPTLSQLPSFLFLFLPLPPDPAMPSSNLHPATSSTQAAILLQGPSLGSTPSPLGYTPSGETRTIPTMVPTWQHSCNQPQGVCRRSSTTTVAPLIIKNLYSWLFLFLI